MIEAGGQKVVEDLWGRIRPGTEEFEFAALRALADKGELQGDDYERILYEAAATTNLVAKEAYPYLVVDLLMKTGKKRCILLVAETLRHSRRWMGNLYTAKGGEAAEAAAACVLPYLDDETTTGGWRQYYKGERDIYRVKDDAASLLNALLGSPLLDFKDLTPPERDEAIRKLRDICAERGIAPAFGRLPGQGRPATP